MLKKIENFTYSNFFLVFAGVAAVFFWATGLAYVGIPLFLTLIFLQFVLFREAMPSATLLFAALFMFSETLLDFTAIPLYLYLTPVSILLGMTIHMIRFKTRFWEGKMLIGILIMFVAMICSSFNADFIDINYLFYALIGLLYAFIYMFYRNSLSRDHMEYLLKMMAVMGMVVAAEVLIFYLRVDDVLLAIATKNLKLGWGLTNYVATYLVMFIPTTIYFAKKAKINFFWILVGVFQIAMLLFTAARGGILAFGVIAIPLAIFLFKSKNWPQSLLTLALLLGIAGFVLWWQFDLFSALYERFLTVMLDDSGRWEIYQEAIDRFVEHPLFGGGLFARIDGNNVYHMYHNTFLHTLATLGLVGFIGLAWQLWVQFRVLMKQNLPSTVILLISLIGAHLHGMVDNIYYMPQFMILMLIIISAVEQNNALLDQTIPQA